VALYPTGTAITTLKVGFTSVKILLDCQEINQRCMDM